MLVVGCQSAPQPKITPPTKKPARARTVPTVDKYYVTISPNLSVEADLVDFVPTILASIDTWRSVKCMPPRFFYIGERQPPSRGKRCAPSNAGYLHIEYVTKGWRFDSDDLAKIDTCDLTGNAHTVYINAEHHKFTALWEVAIKPGKKYNLQLVILHELGHALGLDDQEDYRALSSGHYASIMDGCQLNEENFAGFTRLDITKICALANRLP